MVALLLFVLEGVLALSGVQPLGSDPYAGFSGFSPLFTRGSDSDGSGGSGGTWVTHPDKLRWFNAQSFADPKPAGSLRIFSLGGSTTYGRPYDQRTSFSAWLAELLDLSEPDRPHEVINAGGISYASDRVLAVLREVLEHEPDAIVVYTGHNEFLEERTYRDVAAAPQWVRNLGGLLSGTRTFAGAYRLFVAPAATDLDGQSGDELTTRLDSVVGPLAYERDDALRGRIIEHFRHNLERMASLAADASVPLILVTPVSSLADCTPFRADDRAGPECDAAALYARGMSELSRGQTAAARRTLAAARDEDICALRAPTEIVDIVREVAARHGLPLVDFEADLRDLGVQVPGREWFLDHVHPTIQGHGVIANGVFTALAAQGLVTRPGDFGPRVYAAARLAIDRRVDPEFQGLALKNLAKVLSWGGKHEEAGRLAAASQQLLGSGDAETHFLQGNSARALGQPDAAALHYRDALALDPAYAEAQLNLAHVLAESGQTAAAEPAVRRALELLGPHAAAFELLGIVLREQQRIPEALAAFLQSLTLDPEVPSAHLNIGLAHLAGRDIDQALQAFDTAVALDPAYVKGHYNLGLLHLARGDSAAARKHFTTVLALDPQHDRARGRLAALSVTTGAGS